MFFTLPGCFWRFAKADLDGLKEDLGATDWSFLGGNDACSGAELMTRMVLSSAAGRIPKREITIKRKTHPWLNERILQLVAKKHAASGSPDHAAVVLECSKGIVEEFLKYACESRKKLCAAKRGSKLWWTISREILLQKTKTQSIPALMSEDGVWVHEPKSKADL